PWCVTLRLCPWCVTLGLCPRCVTLRLCPRCVTLRLCPWCVTLRLCPRCVTLGLCPRCVTLGSWCVTVALRQTYPCSSALDMLLGHPGPCGAGECLAPLVLPTASRDEECLPQSLHGLSLC
uniref:Uncharacterized protein n=1 Tax=Melopsittacus undulatus TaxID=13146 RepID=A0A8V5FV07_MELUD